MCPPSDFACLGTCAQDYGENKNTCPAESTTTLATTTTAKIITKTTPRGTTTPKSTTTSALPRKSVLILYKKDFSNKAVVIDENGKEEDDFSFTFGENTEVSFSCSITWHGELYIFGGDTETKQITKLNGCKLERVGRLAFHHKYGSCAVVNDQDIYLCFDRESSKTCRKASEPMGIFEEINQTRYHHKSSRIGVSTGKYNVQF